ncbi:extracellular solute-binding protein [Paenibacillus senegalensis]|uniref:extracellular solute-binding protein n=1 Tax=Paenibacillus senegalensis TaxID=1465766 RepID=UPI0002883D5F|nr:extracellular solute-binding protein [Paenibacillus senegalensis]
MKHFMSMHRKKTVVLSTAALTLLISACSGGSQPTSSPSASPSSSPSPSASNGAQVEEKPVLRQLMPYGRFEADKEPVAIFLEEQTGYKVEYEMLPAEQPDEKLNLLMANKEPYDFMKIGRNQFAKLVTSGALEPLNDLLDQYGHNLRAAIAEESWQAATIDGKIYAIPETGGGITIGTSLVVRKDWMDELNLEIPTNTAELKEVLRELKAKKNVIPLTMMGSLESVYPEIAGTFGLTTDWVEQDGQLVHSVETDAAKNYLAYMAELYSEGLVDSELGINTSAKAIEKFTSGQAAMYRLAWWDAEAVVEALKKNFPEAEIAIIPYLKNDQGEINLAGSAGANFYTVIPSFAKNKEHAMQYLDMKLQEDIFKGLAIGMEGEHFEFKDDKYYPLNPKFNDEWNNASSFMTGVDERVYPTYWQARVRKNIHVQTYFETYQENAGDNIHTDPLAFAPPIENVSKNVQKLKQLKDDNFINFISNVKPLSEYDSFIREWKAQGGEEMTTAANEWYTANK